MRALCFLFAAYLLAVPLAAQPMQGMDMPGMGVSAHHPMAMPPRPGHRKPPVGPEAPAAPRRAPHAVAHGHAGPATAPMPISVEEAPVAPTASGTDLPAGQGAPPPPPTDHAADAVYGVAVMAASRADVHHEHGGMTTHLVMLNLAEAQVRDGRDGYRWDAEAWWGGDINRFVAKSENERRFGRSTGDAEVQALYSRAIGPYFDLQAGVRQDIGAGPRRTYASIGVEGLAPYMFETEATLFLSDRGDVLARAEAWYDQRITQHLIAQPRVELNFAAQTVSDRRIGGGLSTAELGLRLRYEITRQFAPYVGVSWDRKVGRTARFAREDGEGAGGAAAVFGVRAWF
ncbi:copper resistance protein B [Sphingomonas oryzagri]